MCDGVRPCSTAHPVHRQIHRPHSISPDALGPQRRGRCSPSPGLRLSRRCSPHGCRLNADSGSSAHARYVDFSPNFKPQYLRNTRWNQATRGLFFLSAGFRSITSRCRNQKAKHNATMPMAALNNCLCRRRLSPRFRGALFSICGSPEFIICSDHLWPVEPANHRSSLREPGRRQYCLHPPQRSD